MLEEKISKKRKELDESLQTHQDYSTTYRLSVELDDLIAEFYKTAKERSEKKKETKEERKILYMV